MNRYSVKEIDHIWSEKNKFYIQYKIEIAALKQLIELKIVKSSIPKKLKSINVKRIKEIEKTVKHETIAFITYLEEVLNNNYIHYGLTSSDVLDTSLSIQVKQSIQILNKYLANIIDKLNILSIENYNTLVIGRSHGIHGEPTTFGLLLAGYKEEFIRAKKKLDAVDANLTGKLSSAMGNNAHFPIEAEINVLKSFGLSRQNFATQVIPRDIYADYFYSLTMIASAIERFCNLIRHSQRTEVNELEEFFDTNQKGSSAMPHKKNPILSENLCGLSRIVKSTLNSSIENCNLWYERDMSHSSVERYNFPVATSTLAFMLIRFFYILSNLKINKDKMLENLNLSKDKFFSQKLMLLLINKGLSRVAAYKIMQEISFKSTDSSELKKFLSEEEINNCFNLDSLIQYSKDILIGTNVK